MEVKLSKKEYAAWINVVKQSKIPQLTAAHNAIFSDNPPEGFSWNKEGTSDNITIVLNIPEDVSTATLDVLAKHLPTVGATAASLTALPKLIATLKEFGADMAKVFSKRDHSAHK